MSDTLKVFLQTLYDLDEYLEGRADINREGTGPNEAMRLLMGVRELIHTIEKEQQ